MGNTGAQWGLFGFTLFTVSTILQQSSIFECSLTIKINDSLCLCIKCSCTSVVALQGKVLCVQACWHFYEL